jgi:hypothetical protein
MTLFKTYFSYIRSNIQYEVIHDGVIDPFIFCNCSLDLQSALQDALDCEEDFHNEDVIIDIVFECDQQHKSQQFIDNCIAYVARYVVFQLRSMAICKIGQLALQNTAEDSLPADKKKEKRGINHTFQECVLTSQVV